MSGAEAGQRLFERARQPTQRERAAAHSVGRGSAAASLGTRTRHAGAESVRFAPVCACARAGAFPLWRARPRLHAACPSRPPVAHEHTLSRTARQALGGGGGAPRAGQSTCCAVSGSAASASAATRSSVRALAIVSSLCVARFNFTEKHELNWQHLRTPKICVVKFAVNPVKPWQSWQPISKPLQQKPTTAERQGSNNGTGADGQSRDQPQALPLRTPRSIRMSFPWAGEDRCAMRQARPAMRGRVWQQGAPLQFENHAGRASCWRAARD